MAAFAAIIAPAIATAGSTSRAATDSRAATGTLPDCEWCGAAEASAGLGWETRLAPPGEPGDPLVISGSVFRGDGRTPASGVVLYVYHTDRGGVYPRRGDETGNGRRHGYLRGWMRTDARGRYKFTTIRPGAYPGGDDPAHIHATVLEPGREESYIDDYNFEGDPLLTSAYRARLRERGGPGIISLTRQADGTWSGTRDIVLRD